MDDANTTDGGYDVNQTWLNVTGDGHVSVQHPYEARIVEIVFTGVVTTLIILSNGVVLVAIATNSAFRDIRFLFIGNLAAIDLITGVTMAYNFVSIFVAEALSYYACLTVFVLVEFSLRMSSLSMLLVTANQYLLIVHPLRYPALMNAAVARRLLAAAWIVCAVIYSLPYAGWNGGGGTGECLLLLVFSDSFMFVWDVALFVVPAAIMVALYAEIFIVARRHCRQIAAQEVTVQSRDTQQDARANKKRYRELKTAVTLAIVVIVYVLSWAPMIIIRFLNFIYAGDHRYDVLVPATIATCNSFCNPFIYALRSAKFRRAYRRVLCCGTDRCKPDSDTQVFSMDATDS